ncbi:Piso0_002996 [Millerozyma farinosa CBS 7064]|uniref:Polyprenal reductase n=1 Tax=Pichia sorbitophila (strain ATCC MYA-4447 / BCRC 22081 / CBS 7064 / NBRC 10061 / NRRL Y-12695) TaxID=559304 RepID=G8YK24_PICSO|nr:Piso0_002996 [Millerozyma farinosa CBS 7064]CCE80669.1 Piso0_002996 [Millerozyma farinosa CBS 7064]
MQIGLPVLITSFYTVGIVVICVIKKTHRLDNLLKYGKTLHRLKNNSSKIGDALTKLTVPKKWFTHFYIEYLALCIATWVLVTHGSSRVAKLLGCSGRPEKSLDYTIILILLTIQSSRRLFECIFVTKFSNNARMNVSHYLMGLSFYASIVLNTLLGLSSLLDGPHKDFLSLQKLDIYVLILITFFCLFSIDQFHYHSYLAQLRKYSIPTFGLFKVVACPHYLDEILIYFTVMLLGIRNFSGSLIEVNYILAWIFVTTNLSISSLESLDYYRAQYKDCTIKYGVIPKVL